jgi:hypothetical protein
MFLSLGSGRSTGRPTTQRGAWPRSRARLCLEPLEDRSLLTAPATFSGLPYIVGPTVQVTHTAPAAEEVVAVDPNNSNTLVAAIIDASQAVGLNASTPSQPIVEKYAFSFNNGATWTEKFNPNVTSDGQVWAKEFDPSLAVDKLGNVYLGSVYQVTSSNGDANGVYVNVAHLAANDLTFSAAHTFPIETNLAANESSQTDQPWITVDNSTSPYGGSVYALWQQHSANINQSTTMLFARSTDQGKTWSTPMTISSTGQGNDFLGAQLAVGPHGEVYAVYQVSTHKFTQAQFFLAKSTDGGQTFTSPIAITPVFNDLTFASTYAKGTYPSLAVSPVDGTVFVTYADQPDGMSSQIEFIRSTDGGVTFSSPVVINDSLAGQHFMQTLTVDGNGVLHASWFDGRNSPTDSSKYDVYATYSLDDGTTFSPNARVTPSLLDSGGAQVIGDYAGIAAAGGFAHPVWVSGGVHFPPFSGDGVLQTATLQIPAATDAPLRAAAASVSSVAATSTASPLIARSSGTSPAPLIARTTLSSSLDPAALSLALSLSRLPATPIAATTPPLSFTPTPLLTLSLTSNLPKADSSQSDETREKASDSVFANLDDGLFVARLVEDWSADAAADHVFANLRR